MSRVRRSRSESSSDLAAAISLRSTAASAAVSAGDRDAQGAKCLGSNLSAFTHCTRSCGLLSTIRTGA